MDFMKPHTYRHYDPRTGRFISEDPIDFGGGDFNLYRYVKNKLPNATDPTGKYTKEQGLILIVSLGTSLIVLKLLYEKFKNKGIEKEFTEKIITTQIGCGIYKQEKIVEYDQGAIQRNKERLEKLNTLGKEIDERQRILNELIGNGNTYDPGRA